MSIINTNKPNFFGNNGVVLVNGFIYIGEPGQDPINNPKTVTFTDAAGNSFTAAQPLTTNSEGKIQYNGKAIIAEVTGDYSQLILDSTETEIKDGYTPIITEDSGGGGSTDLTDYTENGLLLADVKQLDKAPGQTVRSVGKISTEDGAGVLWLVVSNTGGNADDVDLIDFDNGLQGVRIGNDLAVVKNLSDLDNVATARTNLDVYSKAQTNVATAAFNVIGSGSIGTGVAGPDGLTMTSVNNVTGSNTITLSSSRMIVGYSLTSSSASDTLGTVVKDHAVSQSSFLVTSRTTGTLANTTYLFTLHYLPEYS